MILSTHGILGSQIQSFVGLLDTYPNAAAAYSVRKLRGAYTGNAIRVRRSSDNTETDIGFTALGNLDTTTLNSFCSGTNGFVTTWYDQSGNAANATQTTAANQPQIVSSGSVILDNLKPAIKFTGQPQFMNLSNVSFANGITNFNVIHPDSYGASDYWQLINIYNGSSNNYGISFSLNASYDNRNIIFGTVALSNDNVSVNLNQQILTGYYDGVGTLAADGALYLNGSNLTLNASQPWGAINTNSLLAYFGTGGGVANYYKGLMQEIILYPSNQTGNNTGINTNINSYYAIY
jgi:hypothetical protein